MAFASHLWANLLFVIENNYILLSHKGELSFPLQLISGNAFHVYISTKIYFIFISDIMHNMRSYTFIHPIRDPIVNNSIYSVCCNLYGWCCEVRGVRLVVQIIALYQCLLSLYRNGKIWRIQTKHGKIFTINQNYK